MTAEEDSTNHLDNEKALAFAAVAAFRWNERQPGEGASTLRFLMRATSWVNRARAWHSLPPLTLDGVVQAFEQPVGDWLPPFQQGPLIDEREPSALCLDLADAAGRTPGAEIEQRAVLKAMENLGSDSDAPERYTRFRRFLIENAATGLLEARQIALTVGLNLADLYEEIGNSATLLVDGEHSYLPCPRCGWPMRVSEERIACSAAVCERSGARYGRRGEQIIPLGTVAVPEAHLAHNRARLRYGLWRYTVLPGLEELALFHKLREIPGVTVELWPLVDRYDLDVQLGGRRWRVDVKDHALPGRLAAHLNEREPPSETWIVVPDVHRTQVAVLERLCGPDSLYRFCTSANFLGMVRRARGNA